MFDLSIRKDWRNFGEIFRRFLSFNFQGKWPQEISHKFLHTARPQIPHALNQNSFTARLWELGGPKIEKRGTPGNCWGGCWEECWEECWGNSGCWTECWQGCCEGVFSWKGMRSSTLANTPPSTPNFPSTLPSSLPIYFLGLPASLFCSRPPDSQV